VSEILAETVSVLTQLREGTRTAHLQLEATLNLLDARLNREDYVRILGQFHSFWQSWQPLTARLIDDPDFTCPRERLHMLTNDLCRLGVTPAAIEGLPDCPMPPLANAAEALGSLYVMEGSTLGGRVIEKNLLLRLGIVRETGGSYFAGYGERTGQMWRDFLFRLGAAPAADAPQIKFGANATFSCLTSWFAAAI
jgi:heme oxygenase